MSNGSDIPVIHSFELPTSALVPVVHVQKKEEKEKKEKTDKKEKKVKKEKKKIASSTPSPQSPQSPSAKKRKIPEQTSNFFSCSICQEQMVKPVTTVCGHNFCKNCITDWVEKTDDSTPKCPLCKCSLGNRQIFIKKIGVNKIIEELIQNSMKDDETYSKRLRKNERLEERTKFFQKYIKSKRYRELETQIVKIVQDECSGTAKYTELLKKLMEGSKKFEKAEVDFFLYEECVKQSRFLLIGEYVVDYFFNPHLSIGGFLLEYLKAHPQELLYVCTVIEMDSDAMKNYEVSQSEFFKNSKILDGKSAGRKLMRLKNKVIK